MTLGLLVGFVAVFALFQVLAGALGSLRGEYGLIVGGTVVAALMLIEMVLWRRRSVGALLALGFGRPRPDALVSAAALGAMMIAVVPIYAFIRNADLVLQPGWLFLLPGLFAQGGVAEEALFRGYLFGHLREGRSFWRAAFLSTVPFVAVHLFMFATFPWPVALASLLLAVAISFPLAHLFELGGRTIWAPAILHFVIQGTVKVVSFPTEGAFPIVWIAAALVVPWIVFLVPRSRAG
jgi:membrane protease YdiL (CAAX protease family)